MQLTNSLDTTSWATPRPTPRPRITALMEGRIRWRILLFLLVMIGAQVVSIAMGAITLSILVIWSLRSPRAALQALSLGIILTFLNPAIASAQPGASSLKWLLLITAGCRLLIRPLRGTIPAWLVTLVAFTVICISLAAFVSATFILSIFKLLTFAFGVTVVIAGYPRI